MFQYPLLHLCIYQTTSSTSQHQPTKALLPNKSTPTTHTVAAAGEKDVPHDPQVMCRKERGMVGVDSWQ